MVSTSKAQVKLLLVIAAIDLAVSCLLTNCPRGGKKRRSHSLTGANDLISIEPKKCTLCEPDADICFGSPCLPDLVCENEGICVSENVCCSKNRFCKVDRTCKISSNLQIVTDYEPESMVFSRLLSSDY